MRKGVASMILVDPGKGQDRPVVLVEGNRHRFRGSVRATSKVTFGFEAHSPAGGSDHQTVENIDGTFDFVLPVDEFPLVRNSSGVAPDISAFGRVLGHVFCFASSDAGLEITRVELLAPE